MRVVSVLFCSVIVMLLPTLGNAQQLIQSYNNWSVFKLDQNGRTICYMASTPVKGKSQGSFKKRGEPYFLVTSVQATKDEVSASSGYPYKDRSEVDVTVDSKPYKLFTKGEISWAYEDGVQDATMVNHMKQGTLMSVQGNSQKGTFSKDYYSLNGFSKAYEHMKSLCR